ncbi:hypothetical protein A9P82_12815 [Arachidicoccus ginsenosidimutans]|uniref:helix-turn-helix domain-containing protein n=1 Tax=Arachidicoccus sp. BS20 TaxID=1850526 RepID=UPI0007F1605E|nr:AraC family transcriptional regulator [Arachidicoccus sp. BS20]ANI90085.1 hypothetical protein A9P82_12815 [Arachidicoccus sp. BS20]
MKKSAFDQLFILQEMQIQGTVSLPLIENRFYLVYLETSDADAAFSVETMNISSRLGSKNLLVFDTTTGCCQKDIVISTTSQVTAHILCYTSTRIGLSYYGNVVFLEVYSKGIQLYSSNDNAIEEQDFDMVKLYFTAAAYLVNKSSAYTQFMPMLNILSILACIKSWYMNAESLIAVKFSEAGEIAYRYNSLLDEHFKKEIALNFYVKQLQLRSSRELYDATQKIFGVSPKQMMQRKVISEAQKMLLLSNLSIKEIGYELGFSEPTNFNKFFQKHCNISPKGFREKAKRNEL